MKYCESYAALLDPFIDGELSPEDMIRVQAHLDECPACRAYVDDALAIRAAFPDVEDTQMPADFAENVMSRIRAEAAVQKRKSRPWLKVLAPLAACCAIVLLAAPMFSGGVKTEAAPAAAADTVEAPTERVMEFSYTAKEAPAAEERTTELAEELAEPAEAPAAGKTAQAPSIAAAQAPTTYCDEADTGSWLTLTAEEAGSLLADFTPAEETETELRYELTSGELETLLAALSEAGIVPSGELHPVEAKDASILVIVIK